MDVNITIFSVINHYWSKTSNCEEFLRLGHLDRWGRSNFFLNRLQFHDVNFVSEMIQAKKFSENISLRVHFDKQWQGRKVV